MDLDGGGVAVTSPTDQSEPSHPQVALTSAASSACPRLVLLPPYGKLIADSTAVSDAETATSAASCTSTGRRFRVSFGLVPSPEISTFCYSWVDPDPQADDRRAQRPIVLAVHGDCLLLEVTTPSTARWSSSPRPPPNYFVYQASAAGRRPSLLLLPSCYIPRQYERRHVSSPSEQQDKARNMLQSETGLLQRGKDDMLVAQLEVDTEEQEVAELCLLRPGRDMEWHLKRVPVVVYDDDKGNGDDCQDYEGPLKWWWNDAAFAVGDRFLSWVDYLRGFLFADMAAEKFSLRLRYMRLPVELPSGDPHDTEHGRSNMQWSRNLAPAHNGSLRFVDVESCCCCGDLGSRTSCERGRFLFTVTTWTLKLSINEPMEWVKDGVLDCDELWAQPGYSGLPRVKVEYPIVVNSDDADAVCFVVQTDYRCYSTDIIDRKAYRIEVDTRRKVLRSVVPYGSGDCETSYFPAKIEYTKY